MKFRTFAFLTFLFAVHGVAATAESGEMTPMQAIFAAAEHTEGVSGIFTFEVKGSGRGDGRLYLNSEPDYRDQRCLTVSIASPVETELRSQLGGDPAVVLKGKRIRVDGRAQRVTIWFFIKGVKTDFYYYQTQIDLLSAASLVYHQK
jgi:hypothetical protein